MRTANPFTQPVAMTHAVSPLQPWAARRAMAPRGVLLATAALALALAVAVLVGSAREGQASVSERLQTVRAVNDLRVGTTQALVFGDFVTHAGVPAAKREGSVRHGLKPDFVKPLGNLGNTGLAQLDANDVAAAAAAVASKSVANVNMAADSAGAATISEPGFVIAATDDRAPASEAMAHTSKLVLGPGAFEAALRKRYKASLAMPLVKLADGTVVADAKLLHSSKISKLDMADEGDKSVQVAAAIKDTVGEKSAEGTNLTSSEPAYGSPDDMKAVEEVQAAVKAAADAEVDEAVATSQAAAKSSYAETRDNFLKKEAKNNMTGTLLYSASDEIYHDSNKWVKELKSFKQGGQDLSERPERAFSVAVPAGVLPGHTFLVQVPGAGEMRVTVPQHVVAGQTIAIEVPVAVGPAKSLANERRDIKSKEAAAVAQEQTLEKAQVEKMAQSDSTLAARLEAEFLADKQKIEKKDQVAEERQVKMADMQDHTDGISLPTYNSRFSSGISLPTYNSAKAIEGRYFADKKKLEKKLENAAKFGLPAAVEQVKPEVESKEVHAIKQATADLQKSFLKDKMLFGRAEKMSQHVAEKASERALGATLPTMHTQKMRTHKQNMHTHTHARPRLMASKKEEGRGPGPRRATMSPAEADEKEKRAQEDEDHEVRAPPAVNLMDGDQKMRGGPLPKHTVGGYWDVAAVDGGYYDMTVPSGLAAGMQFLAQIPNGPEMLVTVPKGMGAGSHIAIHQPQQARQRE